MGNRSSLAGSRYWVSGYPRLVEEWDWDRNGILTPEIVRAGSGRRVWWKCKKGSDQPVESEPEQPHPRGGVPVLFEQKNVHHVLPTLGARHGR